MNQEEFELFKKLTGEAELPPKGSIDRKILENYGLKGYVEILNNRKSRQEDHNGDDDPLRSRDKTN